jgi:hypothetical protein
VYVSPLLRSGVQWDVLTHGNQVQEVSRIPNGANPGNCISLLRVSNQLRHPSMISNRIELFH